MVEGMFDPKAAGENMLKLMRSSSEAMFDNLVRIQELNEKMLKDMIAKGQDMQPNMTEMMDEFIENAKKGRDEYRKVMENGFKKMEDFLKTGK